MPPVCPHSCYCPLHPPSPACPPTSCQAGRRSPSPVPPSPPGRSRTYARVASKAYPLIDMCSPVISSVVSPSLTALRCELVGPATIRAVYPWVSLSSLVGRIKRAFVFVPSPNGVRSSVRLALSRLFLNGSSTVAMTFIFCVSNACVSWTWLTIGRLAPIPVTNLSSVRSAPSLRRMVFLYWLLLRWFDPRSLWTSLFCGGRKLTAFGSLLSAARVTMNCSSPTMPFGRFALLPHSFMPRICLSRTRAPLT